MKCAFGVSMSLCTNEWMWAGSLAGWYMFWVFLFAFRFLMPSLSIKTEYIVANGVCTLTTFSHITLLTLFAPQNHCILVAVNYSSKISVSNGEPALTSSRLFSLLRVKVSKQWDHTLCLYILSRSRSEQVFNSVYAFELCLSASLPLYFSLCVYACWSLFLFNHKNVYTICCLVRSFFFLFRLILLSFFDQSIPFLFVSIHRHVHAAFV